MTATFKCWHLTTGVEPERFGKCEGAGPGRSGEGQGQGGAGTRSHSAILSRDRREIFVCLFVFLLEFGI